jgi:exopolysaccharide biosynthesis protein
MSGRKKRTKLIVFISSLVLVIGTILYILADRYLIEHVESRVRDNETAAGQESSVTAADTDAKYDDWNYKSDDIDISIQKVQTGSGSGKVTYFVADVRLSDASSLYSAFAKNLYGRNIVEDTSKIASDNNAILAINGDYYGFRSDGVLIRNGTLYRDAPARIGAAILKDGTLETYDETEVSSEALLAKGVMDTLSFGPVLLKDGKAAGDFESVKIDRNFGNTSIQDPNPRTGIGMISPNHFVFVVVDGRSRNYSRGMTLKEFADLFASLGCSDAYNLDGGGSSTMYFMGRVVNNPQGKGGERAVSDILYIK